MEANEIVGLIVVLTVLVVSNIFTASIATTNGITKGWDKGYKQGRIRGMEIQMNGYIGYNELPVFIGDHEINFTEGDKVPDTNIKGISPFKYSKIDEEIINQIGGESNGKKTPEKKEWTTPSEGRLGIRYGPDGVEYEV